MLRSPLGKKLFSPVRLGLLAAVIVAALAAALSGAGCASSARLPVAAGTGPNPDPAGPRTKR